MAESRRSLGRLVSIIASLDRPVPILVGAGASISGGSVSATNLARDMVARLYPFDVPSYLKSESDGDVGRLRRFEDIMADLGGGPVLTRIFLAEYLNNLRVTPAHEQLVELIKDRALGPWIFTTNFDNLLETAMERRGLRAEVVLGPSISSAQAGVIESTSDVNWVVKLHGDPSVPATLRTNPDEVAEFSRPLVRLLRSVVLEHGLLVIGHRLRDPDINAVLESMPPTNRFLGVVTLDEPTEQANSLLRRHRSDQNWVNAPFETFIQDLSTRIEFVRFYEERNDEMADVWDRLDQLRFRVVDPERRAADLHEISGVFSELKQPEARAIAMTSQFEASARTDWWALTRAVTSLRECFDARHGLPRQVRLRLSFRCVQEFVRSIFLGLDLSVSPADSSRYTLLEEAILSIRQDELELTTTADFGHVDQAALEIYSAEALKELHTIKPRRKSSLGLEDAAPELAEARRLLDSALKRLDAHQPGHGWSRAGFLRGVALRHLSIVHEYIAALPIGEVSRRDHSRRWVRFSREADRVLENVGEAWARAYALMNWATSELAHSALYESDTLSPALIDSAIERLERARLLFHDLHDERGLAWVHVELAIAFGRMQQAPQSEDERRASSLKSMYRNATIARSWSRRVGTDPIVSGFSDYLCAFSLLELTRSELLVHDSRERQLLELLNYAEAGQQAFKLTHRIPQAAKCCQIKGEALFLLGQDQRSRTLRLLSEAIKTQGEAVELLAEGFEIDERTLEAKFSDLNRALENILTRVAL